MCKTTLTDLIGPIGFLALIGNRGGCIVVGGRCCCCCCIVVVGWILRYRRVLHHFGRCTKMLKTGTHLCDMSDRNQMQFGSGGGGGGW